MELQSTQQLPKQIAIIMDGNGRWAESRNLPRTQGHLEGVKRIEEIVEAARRRGIMVLTVFTFSTENWTRPQYEVSMLMGTLVAMLGQKARELHKNNIRLQVIGRRDGVPDMVLKTIDAAAELTRKNTGMILNMAFNYGGRREILDATVKIAQKIKNDEMRIEDINEQAFSSLLYTNGLPDPDLLIRTSGEKRISNFLLWQLSYAEFYFTEKFWPDFNEQEFDRALEDYKTRERRYGNVVTNRG